MTEFGADRMSPADDTVRLAHFVRSKVFANLFAHGMELVEETATYLDNGGRQAAKQLPREQALTYAGISMRLTTRLMQIASWLLVLRAVRDGEMSESEAHQDKYRIGRPEPSDRQAGDNASMPEALCDLIVETDTLYARIARLDGDLFNTSSAGSVEGDAKGQMAALAKAFEGL